MKLDNISIFCKSIKLSVEIISSAYKLKLNNQKLQPVSITMAKHLVLSQRLRLPQRKTPVLTKAPVTVGQFLLFHLLGVVVFSKIQNVQLVTFLRSILGPEIPLAEASRGYHFCSTRINFESN